MKLDKVDARNWDYIRLFDGSIGAKLHDSDRVMINNSKTHRDVLDSKYRREGNTWYEGEEEVAEIKCGRIYSWVEVVIGVFGIVTLKG